jgi:hypothetical protein
VIPVRHGDKHYLQVLMDNAFGGLQIWWIGSFVQKARSGTTVGRGGVQQITGAELEEGTAAMKRVALCLELLILEDYGIQADRAVSNACRDGGNSWSAAQAPAGMRQVLKRHRIVKSR